jgi:hypothetical protein
MRVLTFPLTAVVVLVGVWVAGGVISNDFETSIALTTVWFGLSGLISVALALRVRAVRVPVLAGYAVTAVAVAAYLGSATLRDRVADEQVVMANVPAVPMPGERGTEMARMASDAPPMNVQLARGRFVSGEHATRGVATVVRVPDGRRFLTLTSFETDAGPDLRVRLVRGDESLDLGALKGNKGDQQYQLPRGAVVRGRTVVIWCRAFSVAFGSAEL